MPTRTYTKIPTAPATDLAAIFEAKIGELTSKIDALTAKIESLDDQLANAAESSFQLAELLEHAQNNRRTDEWSAVS